MYQLKFSRVGKVDSKIIIFVSIFDLHIVCIIIINGGSTSRNVNGPTILQGRTGPKNIIYICALILAVKCGQNLCQLFQHVYIMKHELIRISEKKRIY